MKIRLDRQVMADAVAWAARVLPSRPPMPILAGLFIKADASGVTLSGFDMESSAKITVPAEVTDEGEALVHGKLLADIAKSLPNMPVEISSDATKAELVCGSARFTLQTLPVSEYPELPAMPDASGTVKADVFGRAISQVSVAAGRDELLPIFTGIRMEINGDRLSLLATDRYRMALKELVWTPKTSQMEETALVPAKVLSEVSRLMTTDGDITVSLSNNGIGEGLIGLQGADLETTRQLTTRLLDGEFPKVRHLMDVIPTVSVRVNREELVASAKRVSLVADRNTPIRMIINQDGIRLEAATGDQAQASEAVNALVQNHEGGEMAVTAVGFNPHYLNDALVSFNTEFIYFAFTAPGRPSLLCGIDSLEGKPQEDYKHVIMLMRLPS